jgi:cell division septum initiation protein DivIVA
MSTGSDQNGWNEYSKLVINELERLNEGIKTLNEEIQSLKQQITELKTKEDNVKDLKLWKAAVDEVSSPTQLKELSDDVKTLKTFKTQAITVWAVVQFIFGILIAFLKFF